MHALKALLLLADDGRLTLVDTDMNVKATWTPQRSWHIIQAFFIAKEEADTTHDGPEAVTDILVLVVEEDQSLIVQVIGLSDSGNFEDYEPMGIPNIPSGEVLDVSFDPSGFLSILGKCHFSRIAFSITYCCV